MFPRVPSRIKFYLPRAVTGKETFLQWASLPFSHHFRFVPGFPGIISHQKLFAIESFLQHLLLSETNPRL
jgi:hypothetical protein